MTDVLGICLAVGVFHIHHLQKKQAVPEKELPAGVFVMSY